MARVDTAGLRSALELLAVQAGEAAGAVGEAEEDLFGEAPRLVEAKGVSGPKGGRPKGARNRSTDQWAQWLLARYGSSLDVLGQLMTAPTGKLVDELQAMADKHKKWRETKEGGYWTVVQIDPLAVLKLQMAAAQGLALYQHKQQPKALELDSRPRGVVVLADCEMDAGDVIDGDALPISASQQNQGVSDGARCQSDGEPSDATENPSETAS